MSEIIKLRKQVKDLKLYIGWLESELDEKDVIEWDDVCDMIFAKPVYTSKQNEDAMTNFHFISEL